MEIRRKTNGRKQKSDGRVMRKEGREGGGGEGRGREDG